MFFSALTLAVLLQTAPAAPVAPPAPVPGKRGYLLQQEPFDPSRPLEKNSGPFVKPTHRLTPDEARALGSVGALRMRPPRKARPPQPRPRQFALGPAASCKKITPERVAKTDDLKRQPLSKMPMARTEYAVARTVDGCPVAVLVASAGPVR